MTDTVNARAPLSSGRWLVLNVLLTLAYFVFGRLGLALALPPGYVSAIWPAAGVAFAVALVWGGGRVWPGILLGSLITNAMHGDEFRIDGIALGIAAGSALQAVVGSWWLRRDNPGLVLDSPARVLRFSLVGILSCLIAASVGNLVLLVGGVISPNQVAQSFVTWWLGDAFGVQIFAPLTLLALAPNLSWRSRRVSVGLPLLLAFSLCGVIYFYVSEAEERQLLRDFANKTAGLHNELKSLDRIHGTALLHLASIYQLTGRVPGAEFPEVAAQLHKRLPAFSAISWVPVIDQADDLKFAAMARSVGMNFSHMKYPPGFAPAADHRAAPVLFIYPIEGNAAAVGVDLLGDPVRGAAVRKALTSISPAVTPPIKLAQDADGPGGVLLMAPVSTTAGQGVMVGVLNLRLIEHELESVPGIIWELHELTPQGSTRAAGNSAGALPAFDSESRLDRAGVYLQLQIPLADRTWRLVLHMPHSLLAASSRSTSLLVLCLALFSCGVFANFALIMSGDRERIGNEVKQKTQALQSEIGVRMNAEQALTESKRLLEDIVENSGMLIFVKRSDGTYLLINRQWETTVGLTREQVLGKTDLELFPGTVGENFRANDVAVMDSGTTLAKEEVLGEGDARRYFYSTKFPLRNAHGEVTGVCGMTTEISELKRYEAELEKARDAAESANIAKSQFLATMSHEIRTPMNGILGMAQLLMMDEVSDEERKDYVRTILGSGQSLMTILNDILDLSKVEAGKMELHLSVFEPATVLNEVAALFREGAQSKGLTLSVVSGVGGMRVLGDALRLRQMLSNLVGNAIKFSDRGCIELTVRLAADAAPASQQVRLEFTVCDQGIGIAEDKLAVLFQPFVQVDGSATRRFGGTGLGLSIVRRLAHLMAGDVRVDSRLGEGSCFTISVLVERVPDHANTRRQERE